MPEQNDNKLKELNEKALMLYYSIKRRSGSDPISELNQKLRLAQSALDKVNPPKQTESERVFAIIWLVFLCACMLGLLQFALTLFASLEKNFFLGSMFLALDAAGIYYLGGVISKLFNALNKPPSAPLMADCMVVHEFRKLQADLAVIKEACRIAEREGTKENLQKAQL